MNELDQASLDRITAKDEPSLTESDKQILRARATYLNAKQKTKFANTLKGKNVAPTPVVDTSPTLRTLKGKAVGYGLPQRGVAKADLEVAVSTVEGADYPKA